MQGPRGGVFHQRATRRSSRRPRKEPKVPTPDQMQHRVPAPANPRHVGDSGPSSSPESAWGVRSGSGVESCGKFDASCAVISCSRSRLVLALEATELRQGIQGLVTPSLRGGEHRQQSEGKPSRPGPPRRGTPGRCPQGFRCARDSVVIAGALPGRQEARGATGVRGLRRVRSRGERGARGYGEGPQSSVHVRCLSLSPDRTSRHRASIGAGTGNSEGIT